jgi:hypothetical protein
MSTQAGTRLAYTRHSQLCSDCLRLSWYSLSSDAKAGLASAEKDIHLYHERADKLLASLETALDDVLSSLAEFDLESSVREVA